jgi:hypothetical protein
MSSPQQSRSDNVDSASLIEPKPKLDSVELELATYQADGKDDVDFASAKAPKLDSTELELAPHEVVREADIAGAHQTLSGARVALLFLCILLGAFFTGYVCCRRTFNRIQVVELINRYRTQAVSRP